VASCPSYEANINNIPLNPSNEEVYAVVEGLVGDLASSQSSSQTSSSTQDGDWWVHLGGDEVVYGCWAEDSSITSFMSQEGFTSYDQVWVISTI